jgi:hypothetical protein
MLKRLITRQCKTFGPGYGTPFVIFWTVLNRLLCWVSINALANIL